MAIPAPRRAPRPPLERTGSSRVEREALEYLRREIRPALRRGERQVLARAITTAVDSGSVEDLGRLGERHRRELLETIESRLGPGRTAPTPRALVRITTVVGAAPDPTGVRSRVVASPAR